MLIYSTNTQYNESNTLITYKNNAIVIKKSNAARIITIYFTQMRMCRITDIQHFYTLL